MIGRLVLLLLLDALCFLIYTFSLTYNVTIGTTPCVIARSTILDKARPQSQTKKRKACKNRVNSDGVPVDKRGRKGSNKKNGNRYIFFQLFESGRLG